MTGQELFEKYTKERSPYARLLLTIYMSLREQLYPILEKAEELGRKVGLKRDPPGLLRDDVSIKDLEFV